MSDRGSSASTLLKLDHAKVLDAEMW
jgi:hypothetical protein